MTPVTSFAGKKVAVFGLGGSGLACARALQAGGAEVIAGNDVGAAGGKRTSACKPRAAKPEHRDLFAGEAGDGDHRWSTVVPGRCASIEPGSSRFRITAARFPE